VKEKRMLGRLAAILSVLSVALVDQGVALADASAEAAPHAHAAHAAGQTPIDCPLEKAGVSPDALHPFADSEKYIEFLERPDRATWQKPDEVVSALHLAGTETLVDVGAGSGYFTFRFAKALPRGKVIAVDVQPEMVRHVHHRVLTEGITNVEAVVADPSDPRVDPSADVVFIADVIHHVQGREAWLQRMFSEMKPGARLVVIEFKEGKLPQGPPESVKIPKAKLTALIREAGFALKSDDPKLLPYQTFLVFQKRPADGAKTSMK
jgi:2-polyprenyl-3-methyl-5-hydroxy-6-metoxy-1,4-benzoquinol methylase